MRSTYLPWGKIKYMYLVISSREELLLIHIHRDYVFYATFGEERSTTKPAMANWVAVKMAKASVATCHISTVADLPEYFSS